MTELSAWIGPPGGEVLSGASNNSVDLLDHVVAEVAVPWGEVLEFLFEFRQRAIIT